jgi:hypothetical protein
MRKGFLRSWWAETWELSSDHFRWWHPCGIALIGATIQARTEGFVIAALNLWATAAGAGAAVALWAAFMLIWNGVRSLPRLFNQQRSEIARLHEQLESSKPKFELIEAGIKHIDVDKSVGPLKVPRQFMFAIAVEIPKSRRPASRITGLFVVTKASLLGPPDINGTIDNGYSETRSMALKNQVNIPQNYPMAFIAVRFDYVDSATGENSSQRWYWKWPGSTPEGLFHSDFHKLTVTETDRFVAYLKAIHPDWKL